LTESATDPKIAIVLNESLGTWQKLNVTAFLSSCIAGRFPEAMGDDFVDASRIRYLGMLRYPVIVYQADDGELQRLYGRAKPRALQIGIYTRALFSTMNEQDNLAAIARYHEDQQDYVGLVFYGHKKQIDKVMKGHRLHP
jgi:hypothetical protein